MIGIQDAILDDKMLYVRLAGEIVQEYSLNEIAENPKAYLDEMECCLLIYVTFE